MRATAITVTVLLAVLLAGCQHTGLFRRQVDIRMEQIQPQTIAHSGNTVELQFYVTANGRPLPGMNLAYRVLPEEAGAVKSLTEATDADGLDRTYYYQNRPISGGTPQVLVEARCGDFVKQFPLQLRAYNRVVEEDMTVLTDQSKTLLEAASDNVYAARLAIDFGNYYDAMLFLTAAETYLDYMEVHSDVEREAKLRREIARYRELVRAAAFPRDEPATEPVVLQNVHFETGKWDLLPQGQPALDAVGTFLRENPAVRIRINGHTDNVPIPMGNLLLSLHRAQAVKEYLMRRHGITTERLIVRGCGDERPRGSNDTVEGRALNRRVDYEIIAQ